MTRALLPLLLAVTAATAQTPPPVSTADAGTAFAMGEALRLGKGVPVDRDQAIAWYRKAAAQGHQGARDALGILLFTKGERKTAIPLLQAAAQRGDPRALYILGTAHFNGDAVPRDVGLAYAEMKRAAATGLPEAQRNLAKMEAFVTPADRARAAAIGSGNAAATPATATTQPMPPPAGAQPTPATAVPADPVTPAALPSVPPSGTGPAAMADDLPASAPATIASPARQTAVPPASMPRPVAVAPVRPKITAYRPAAADAPAGRWRIQLGAYRSSAQADAQWATLAARIPDLGRLPHTVIQAGEFWRLQASGIADGPAAGLFCRRVTAAGGACFAIAP